MEIILLEKVGKLGGLGEVVTVKDGFARNYLLPLKKALRATNNNKAYFESQKAALQQANAEKKSAAEGELKKFTDLIVTLIRQASDDGRLFGSVSPRDIATAINEQGHALSHTMIELATPIRTVGVKTVKLFLHPEVHAECLVNVARTIGEAETALKAHNAGKDTAVDTSADAPAAVAVPLTSVPDEMFGLADEEGA